MRVGLNFKEDYDNKPVTANFLGFEIKQVKATGAVMVIAKFALPSGETADLNFGGAPDRDRFSKFLAAFGMQPCEDISTFDFPEFGQPLQPQWQVPVIVIADRPINKTGQYAGTKSLYYKVKDVQIAGNSPASNDIPTF
jgi:hypothetical protein